MAEQKLIYGVSRGFSGDLSVQSVEIVKETSKRYTLERYVIWAMLSGRHLSKDHPGIAWTPVEAVEGYLLRVDDRLSEAREELRELQDTKARALALLEAFSHAG